MISVKMYPPVKLKNECTCMLRYSQIRKIYWHVNDLSKIINLKSLCKTLI